MLFSTQSRSPREPAVWVEKLLRPGLAQMAKKKYSRWTDLVQRT